MGYRFFVLSIASFIVAHSNKYYPTNTSSTFHWHGSSYVIDSELLNFTEAKQRCQSLNGHLAFVTTPSLLAVIQTLVNWQVYIGLEYENNNQWYWVDHRTNNKWKLPKSDTHVPMWSDEEPDALITQTAGIVCLPENGICNMQPEMELPHICQNHDEVTEYKVAALNSTAPAHCIMLEMDEATQEQCQQKCTENLPCQSFSYNSISNHCQLIWWAASDLISQYAQGYTLFDKE